MPPASFWLTGLHVHGLYPFLGTITYPAYGLGRSQIPVGGLLRSTRSNRLRVSERAQVLCAVQNQYAAMRRQPAAAQAP